MSKVTKPKIELFIGHPWWQPWPNMTIRLWHGIIMVIHTRRGMITVSSITAMIWSSNTLWWPCHDLSMIMPRRVWITMIIPRHSVIVVFGHGCHHRWPIISSIFTYCQEPWSPCRPRGMIMTMFRHDHGKIMGAAKFFPNWSEKHTCYKFTELSIFFRIVSKQFTVIRNLHFSSKCRCLTFLWWCF